MLFRLTVLAILVFLAWRLWQNVVARRPRPPPGGFSASPEQLVRCDRCGVRVPASEIAAIRSNCRQCSEDNGR